MGKKPFWESPTWQIIVAISVILGIPASIIAILSLLGKINLLPLYNFLTRDSFYIISFLTVIIAAIIVVSLLLRSKKHEECILDFQDARRIAILCQTPRTTDFLRQQFEYWQRQSDWVFIGGYGFDDYMKRLEKQDFLKYNSQNGTWRVTQEALDYIAKYHGG